MDAIDLIKQYVQSAPLESFVFCYSIWIALLLWRIQASISASQAGAAAGNQSKQGSGERPTQTKRDGKKRRARAKKAAALNNNQTTSKAATTNSSVVKDKIETQEPEQQVVQRQPVLLADDPRLKAGNAGPVHIGGHTTDLWTDNASSERTVAALPRKQPPPQNDGWSVVPTKKTTSSNKTKGSLGSSVPGQQQDVGDAYEEMRKKKNRKKNEARKAKRDMLRVAQQD